MDLLDVTLREGQQRPNRSYSVDQKVVTVRSLDALGVDAIQVGFPAAGDGTGEVVSRVDVEADLTGIARAVPDDIVAAIRAGVDTVEVFAPTSELQRTWLLDVSVEELIDKVADSVAAVKEADRRVTFTAMDGFRTDVDVLNRFVSRLDIDRFGVADTVGARLPHEIRPVLEGIDAAPSRLAVHFHDDLGVATANAIVAARYGVGQVDVSVAGIGERAGNTPLETTVVAAHRADITTSIDLMTLIPRCREVLRALDESVPSAQPLVGEAVFEHVAGLHTAAMLDDPATFEAFDPESIGGRRKLAFGTQTGRGAARRLIELTGGEPTDAAVDRVLEVLRALDEDIPLETALEIAEEAALR